MKKAKIIIWVVVLAVVLFFATLFVLSLSGVTGAGDFNEKNFNTLVENINNISINVSDREIEVTPSQDEQIYINYFESEKEYYKISTLDGELSIQFVDDKSWIDKIGLKSSYEYRKIKIEIPNNLISNLEIATSNENISISNLSLKENLKLNSNGGNINVDAITVGSTIDLTAKNGNISGSIVGSWDEYSIETTIKKGETNLPTQKLEGTKQLTTNCNNGNITITFINN